MKDKARATIGPCTSCSSASGTGASRFGRQHASIHPGHYESDFEDERFRTPRTSWKNGAGVCRFSSRELHVGARAEHPAILSDELCRPTCFFDQGERVKVGVEDSRDDRVG